MTERTMARIVWGLCGLCIALSSVAVGLMVTNPTPVTVDFGTRTGAALGVVALLALPVVGSLIVVHRRGNRIGWICVAAGVGFSVYAFTNAYGLYAREGGVGSLPGAIVFAWLANSLWVSLYATLATFLVLLFPDGRLLSPRWRAVAWLSAVGIVSMSLYLAFAPGRMENFRIRNPFAVESAAPLFKGLSVGLFVLLIGIGLSAASVVVRFRRSRGVERQQLKWFASAAALVATTFVVQNVVAIATGAIAHPETTPPALRVLQDVVNVSFATIPVAVGIAILRYRLYDIDRIVNRTLVYGALTATLGLIYVGSVFALQWLLRPITAQSDVAIAAATLAVAALFRPARARIQSFIDRRFFRSKYDAQRTIEGFTERLRDEVDLDALDAHLREVVALTVQPRAVSVWLRPSGGNR